MNQSLLDYSHNKSDPIDIKTEQIRLFFSVVPSSLAIVLINSLILAIVQWQQISQPIIVAWLLFTNGLSLSRLWLNHQFEKQSENNSLNTGYWYQLATISGLLSGLSWGAAGIWLFPEGAIHHQVFLAFVLGGMSAGSITALAAIPTAAAAFIILTLTPLIFQFLLSNSPMSYAMTFMLILFLTMMLLSLKNSYKTIMESLTIRYQHDLSEQIIRHQELYDSLTKLPNRNLFLISLDREAALATRHDRWGAVLVSNIDRFQSINDSYGEEVGDKLLIEAAARLRTNLRKISDISARLGGDEFAVLLAEVGANEELASEKATQIADKIRHSFEQPFFVDGQQISLSLSIGVTLFPQKNTHAAELIQSADVAMYQAKNGGGNSVNLFSQSI